MSNTPNTKQPPLSETAERHLLAQVDVVGDRPQDDDTDAPQAPRNREAVKENFAALRDGEADIDLLAAQAAAMHEVAMAALARAGVNSDYHSERHLGVWNAARATTVFLRQLDCLAGLRAARRKERREEEAEREKHAAESQ